MANIFPSWMNRLPLKLLAGTLVLGSSICGGMTYYFTQKYTQVGYQPVQPVPFQHDLHVKQLGMDCRYCHASVEVAAHADVPTTQTCMNCHIQIQKNNPKLAPLRASWETGDPIHWVKVHAAPDYVYFDHSVHVNRGVSCVSCHGKVDQMDVVSKVESQSMAWCLDCHRHPEKSVRPTSQVFNLEWKPSGSGSEKAPREQGMELVKEWGIQPTQNCSGCHR